MTSVKEGVLIVAAVLATAACSTKSASSPTSAVAPPADPVSAVAPPADPASPTCEEPIASGPRLLHSHLIVDEVEPFSSDVTVVLEKDGRNVSLTHRFWERDGGLWASERFDPANLLGMWGGRVDPSRARPELVAKMRSFFEPWGYEVRAVYTLSEGRRIRARELLPLPGGYVDVRTAHFNANRDLSTLSGSPTNTGGSLWSNAPLSDVSTDLTTAHHIGPVGRCGLGSLDRDSELHAAVGQHVLALARGETPDVKEDDSFVPTDCKQQLDWQLWASAPRASGGRGYKLLTFSFPVADLMSPDGATAEVRYSANSYGFTATATLEPIEPPDQSCGEFPLQLSAHVSLSTAQGRTYDAELELEGAVAVDGQRFAVGNFMVPRSRVQLDFNGDPRSIIWDALDGYGESAMRAHFEARILLAAPQET